MENTMSQPDYSRAFQDGMVVEYTDDDEGDGSYPSYWGHDLTGQRVALVTDFGVLDASHLTH
jgi:hypothetical protein